MWLYWQETIEVSYYPAKFGKDKHSDSGDISSFSVSHNLTRPWDQRVMWHYSQKPIKIG